MSKRDYYEILMVERTATDEELKRSYRKLAVQYHPDRNPGDKAAEEKFKECNEAYQILSDPQKRAQYDRFGHSAFGAGGFGGFDPSGFSGSFTDIFDNIFGDIFGRQAGTSAGVDLRYQMEISFEEAAFGAEKKINFEKEFVCEECTGSGAKKGTRPKTCSSCRGVGQVRFNQGFFTLSRTCPQCQGRGSIVEDKCTSCRGHGKKKKSHSVLVKVPAGISDGQRLRLKGEGEIADPSGPAGDLYVQIHVKPHPLFKREDEHVVVDMPISFTLASLGGDLDVPTLAGPASLHIKAGTQGGETIRMKGKGIKRLNGSGFGDQFVRITIETPRKLTSRQKELLKEFEKEGSEETHPAIASFVEKFKDLLRKTR